MAGKVNINTASQNGLEQVPGIGPAIAKKIIDHRPYHSLQDLYTQAVADKRVLNTFIDRLTVADGFDETVFIDSVLPLKSKNDPAEKFVGYRVTASYFVRRTAADGAVSSDLQRTQAGVGADQKAVILLKAGLDVPGQVKVDVEAPTGTAVFTHLYPTIDDFRNQELPALEFDTQPAAVIAASALARPMLIKGRVLDLAGQYKTEDLQLIFLSSDKANARPEDCLPATVAITEREGYFTTFYPNLTAKTIFALVGLPGLPPQPISPEKDRFPEKLLVVIDASAATKPEDTASDCGCDELDFYREKRVLDEFSFFTVVRTTEPEVKRFVLEDEAEIDLEDVIKTTPVKWKAVLPFLDASSNRLSRRSNLNLTAARNLPIGDSEADLLENLKGTRVKVSVLKEFTAKYRLVTPENVGQLIEMNEAARLRDRIFLPPKTNPGRFTLGMDQGIDWDDEPTIFQATTIAHGHLLQYRQEWVADGYSLGDLLYSLPLAPGQKKQIVIYDWERRESAAQSQTLDYQEALTNTLSRDRDINDIANAMVSETTSASSRSEVFGWGVGGGIGAIIPIEVPIGALIGGGLGGGNASSSASQQSARQTSASSMQRLRDKTVQTANALRSQRATVIQTATQGERFQVQSESVANYNHCHALTIEYFEVLRHFKVQIRLVDVQECLFVPLLMSQFDTQKVLRWKNTLNRYLLSRSLRKGFAALERIQNQYEGSDLPDGMFADAPLVYLEGDLFLEFRIARPLDKEDEEFEMANWLWITRLLPFINPLEFHRSYIKSTQQKDRLFVEQLGAAIAETFTRLLVFSAVTAGGEVPLPIDATLVSEFRHKEKLYISLRVGGNLPAVQRKNIQYIKISNRDRNGKSLNDYIPSNTKVIVRSGSMRYRTNHFSGTLFQSGSINNDLTDADDVRIYTPLSPEELRRPKNEDVEAANQLIHHLNENLEYYHKVLWMSMSPERRFMLLDGIFAPEFKDPLTGSVVRRSAASVVENKVVGIVGNCLVMPVAPGLNLDPNFSLLKYDERTGRPTGELRQLLDFYEQQPGEPLHITVPTKGVYAEAVMGKCNSCEKKDETRFWRWEESPIPDSPTAINPVTPPTPTVTQPNLTIKDFPAPIINLQNAPAAPDPQGFGALAQLLSNPNLFRDITGLTENQKNALAAMQRAFQSAEFFGGKAAELTQFAGKMKVLEDARQKGVLTNEQVQKFGEKIAEQATSDDTESKMAVTAAQMDKVRGAVQNEDISPEQGSSLQQSILRNMLGAPSDGLDLDKGSVIDLMNSSRDNGVGFTLANAVGEQLDIQPLVQFASSGRSGRGSAAASAPVSFSHVLPEHFDAGTSSVVSGVVAAKPAELKTTFFDADAAGRSEDAALQTAVDQLINGDAQYKRAKSNLAIALVDLSGAKKFAPTYAGVNDLTNFYAASTAKVTGLLGAYQLKADVDEFLKTHASIADIVELEGALRAEWNSQKIPQKDHPLVSKILEFQAGAPPTVTLRKELLARFDQISKGNENGSTGIVLLRFPYVGSTMLAHGLFSPVNKSGLWVRRPYGRINYLGQKLSLSNWAAAENPHPATPSHSVSAVSMAQFFTLAAQGRMIDRPSSQAILAHLDINKGGCATDTVDLSALQASGFIAVKCGIFPESGDTLHVPLYYKDSTSNREFVLVLLGKNSVFPVFKRLFADLAALVP